MKKSTILLSSLFSASLLLISFLPSMLAQSYADSALTEFSLPSSSKGPSDIVLGPDNNLWFSEGTNEIGRITPSSSVSEFKTPISNSSPLGIVSGPQNSLWFTENSAIGRITTQGVITEFPLPSSDMNDSPDAITVGSDGNLWIVYNSSQNKITRMTPSGQFTDFTIPGPAFNATSIVTGSDGNVWFTNGQSLINVSPSGVATTVDVPQNNVPWTLTASSGSIFFTEFNSGYIGKLDILSGQIQEIHATKPSNGFANNSVDSGNIAIAPNGDIWVANMGINNIGNIIYEIRDSATGGVINTFTTPEMQSGSNGSSDTPDAIAIGPKDTIWLSDYSRNKIVRIDATSNVHSSSIVTNSKSETTGLSKAAKFALFLTAIVGTVLLLATVTGTWKVFVKAGKPGWAAIIPVYNTWMIYELGGQSGWWAILQFIPVVNIVALVYFVIAEIRIAKRFGKSPAFGVLGLFLFWFIGWPVLGFGSAKDLLTN